jgi:hypothetical protein
LAKLDDAQVIREVSERIDHAISQNRQRERIVVAVLMSLFSVGLALILLGSIGNRMTLIVPGGIVQLTVAYPVRRLIKLREDNMRLQIIPQLLRLAEIKEAKVLAAQLISRLINQV